MKASAVALGLAISIPLAHAYTGDLTHYTPSLGSCGGHNIDSDAIVALSIPVMSNPGNPNENPICNKQISIHNPTTGTDTIATVVDTCKGCLFGDIDATISLFNTIAPTGDGRVHNIEWTPIGWTLPGASNANANENPTISSSTVQPSSSAAAAPMLATLLPNVNLEEEKVPAAAAAPSAPVNSSPLAAIAPTTTMVSPAPAAPSSSPSPLCTTPGASVCSPDGAQIGTCTAELTVQMGPVAPGTRCENGYMVLAGSRLRSRRHRRSVWWW